MQNWKPFFIFVIHNFNLSTVKQKYLELLNILRESFSSREASNIANIYFEDKWGIKIESEQEFSSEQILVFNQDINRFKAGEPVQYITGQAYFFNSFFRVDKSVLIPRPETELLVDLTVKKALEYQSPTIIDIGTGSGCIALSIAQKVPNSEILAIDISVDALEIAEINKKSFQLKNVNFLHSDFLNQPQRDKLGKFDIIVSNPPYISIEEKKYMSFSTLNFEPEIALFPKDKNALVFYEEIIEFASKHLSGKGMVLCEINEFKAREIKKLAISSVFNYQILEDMQNKPRILQLWK